RSPRRPSLQPAVGRPPWHTRLENRDPGSPRRRPRTRHPGSHVVHAIGLRFAYTLLQNVRLRLRRRLPGLCSRRRRTTARGSPGRVIPRQHVPHIVRPERSHGAPPAAWGAVMAFRVAGPPDRAKKVHIGPNPAAVKVQTPGVGVEARIADMGSRIVALRAAST